MQTVPAITQIAALGGNLWNNRGGGVPLDDNRDSRNRLGRITGSFIDPALDGMRISGSAPSAGPHPRRSPPLEKTNEKNRDRGKEKGLYCIPHFFLIAACGPSPL